MGRGRGKGRRQSVVVDHDDTASGEDEKLPVRRRGRPQKPLKSNIEEEDKVVKIEKEEVEIEDTKNSTLSKSTTRNQAAAENGRKRKRPSQVKENADPTKEENGVGNKASATDLVKPAGYRQNGSRRKNKPRRAAEVGVECK